MRTAPNLVLLVEKDLAIRLQGANELLDEGYEVVESESASEAMSILDSRDDFDAMVADIDPDQAPGGLALMRYAATHRRNMKLLVESKWSSAEAESIAMAASFLSKPYAAGAMTSEMQDMLSTPMASARQLWISHQQHTEQSPTSDLPMAHQAWHRFFPRDCE